MPPLSELLRRAMADGRIDGHELESLSELIYADGVVDRREAEALIDVHRRIQRVTPSFEKFFYLAIKRHVLTDGRIDAEEADWLRSMIFADGVISEREKKLLRELKGEAKECSPKFEALYEECIHPRTHRTGDRR